MKRTNRMKRIAGILLATLCGALAAHAAPDYPTKPVRFVIPFPAGGPTDGVARTVAQSLSRRLGQPVVVENKPGAEGAIAAQTVAAAPADGYTLLVGTSGVMALPFVAKPAPFAVEDFAPVSTFGRFGFGVYVHPDVPARSVQELVALARARPGAMNFASSNLSEHMATAQFMKVTGADMVRVPYKGAVQAIPDLLAGRVQVYFTPLVAGLSHARQGRLRILATLLPERSPLAPEVPTMREAGFPAIGVRTTQMLLAPAKTPREIVERLSREVNAALQEPEVRAQLEARALFVEGMTPQALATLLRDDGREWSAFARDNGIVQ